MKITTVLIPCLFMLVAVGSKAQTSTQITDEDLKKYAITMDSVEAMQESLRSIVAETVQKNTVMPVPRYNELFKIAGDEANLKESKATPEEIAFLKQIDDLRKVNLARINSTYQALAKDFVGLKAFNVIRKSLQSDQELKVRFDNLSKDLETKEKGG
ncbi:MAG: hypothetical protein WD824_16145 [Cyclobacteriaceae bacterium]